MSTDTDFSFFSHKDYVLDVMGYRFGFVDHRYVGSDGHSYHTNVELGPLGRYRDPFEAKTGGDATESTMKRLAR